MNTILKKVRYKSLTNWSVSHLLANQFGYNEDFKLERIGNFLLRNKTQIIVDDNTVYKRVTIRLFNKGIRVRDTEIGRNIGTKKQFIIKEGQFLMSKIDARNGAFGIAIKEVDEAIITADFLSFDIDETKIVPQFLVLLTTTKQFQKFAQSASSGTTGRQRMDEKKFLEVKIPLPTIQKQIDLINIYNSKINKANDLDSNILKKEIEIKNYLNDELGVENNIIDDWGILNFVKSKNIRSWSVKDLKETQMIKSKYYKSVSLEEDNSLFTQVSRGKSPEYDNNSNNIILNQKCNRWNKIELEHSKKVNKNWYNKIPHDFFTQVKDILINSTGEGTIGRSTYIEDEFEGHLYDSHILLLRMNLEKVNPLFITYYINSIIGQDQINLIKSAVATKQTELGINNLKKIRFILPNLEIQNQICKRIKELKDSIESLKIDSMFNKKNAIQEFEEEIFN